MRPVNLIPPEDRRGDRAPLRAGSLSYVIVGALAAALVAVVGLVMTQNSITDRENEIAELEVARDAATQRAQALAPYAEFATLQTARELTISTLANSRFDWERVLRELALVIPPDVKLQSFEASSAGERGSEDSGLDVGGAPRIVMTGCGPNHDGVAEFVAALEDIDGVTRVGLENSTAGDGSGEGESSSPAATTEDACGRREASFAVTAVFDGVDVAISADPAAAPAIPSAPASGTSSPEEQGQEARDSAGLVTGAAR